MNVKTRGGCGLLLAAPPPDDVGSDEDGHDDENPDHLGATVHPAVCDGPELGAPPDVAAGIAAVRRPSNYRAVDPLPHVGGPPRGTSRRRRSSLRRSGSGRRG